MQEFCHISIIKKIGINVHRISLDVKARKVETLIFRGKNDGFDGKFLFAQRDLHDLYAIRICESWITRFDRV